MPLLLEAAHLALRSDEAEDSRAPYVHAALLLGTCAALKLTNVVLVVPLVLVFAYKALFGARRLSPKRLLTTLAWCFVAFVAPLLPFAVLPVGA